MRLDVVLPKWGLTMSEGTIVRWMRGVGDAVREGEPLVEVETEKAVAEVESPGSGKLVQQLVEAGAIIPVGSVLAVLEVADEVSAPVSPHSGETRPPPSQSRPSPLARRLARELGVDIVGLTGSGPNGLITEADVRAAAAASGPAEQRQTGPSRVERLQGLRKSTAAAMTLSLAQTAQLTLTREVDMGAAVEWRSRTSGQENLTDILLAALARSLLRHPRLNAHLVGDELRLFDSVDIGLAVALEEGLVTPVLRDVAALSLSQISAQRRELVERARAGRLRQSELEGGTFTLTNLGGYGIDAFTPILHYPQVAILGVGAVRSRPAVVGGQLEVRQSCWMSLTFDHRALDGAPAALFLSELAGLLEEPGRLQEVLT